MRSAALRAEDVCTLVLESPLPISKKQIVAALGISPSTASLATLTLAAAGRIEATHPHGGSLNRWGPPGTTQAWQDKAKPKPVKAEPVVRRVASVWELGR